MIKTGYDSLVENTNVLLDMPFEEATGGITRDLAKPHHNDVTLVGTPIWTPLASGTGVLELDGATQYGELAAANCNDLNFTMGAYWFTCWLNWTSGPNTQIIAGRYELDSSGWEIYLYAAAPNFSVSLRHNHASLAPNPVRTACYSYGWTQSRWWFLGINRVGLYPRMYRNGRRVPVGYSVGGVNDPDTCNRDLVIGTRYTKNANFYQNQMWRPRMGSGFLSETLMWHLFQKDKARFGL